MKVERRRGRRRLEREEDVYGRGKREREGVRVSRV